MTHNFMGDAVIHENRQKTPAAHEFRKEGREIPAPDHNSAFRSFYPASLKDVATTATSERERLVESRDDSIVRSNAGAGSDKPRTMRPQITTRRDGQDRATTTSVGGVKELSREIFSPSKGTRECSPHPRTCLDGRKQPREWINEHEATVADCYYYYCNLTPCYVVVVETGGFLTACYPRLSEVVA